MTSDSTSRPSAPGKIRATVIGCVAVLLWSTLALLTTATGRTPPFLLVSLSFGIAFAMAVGKWLLYREPILHHLRQPAVVWALGMYGLFGYHFFYFLALRSAPAVDASLIAYLWPLLIVVLSAALPGERLRWWHVVGAVSGLVGTGLLVIKGESLALRSEYVVGYGASLVCAVIWATYSVANRRFASVPTDAVGGVCGATAVLAAICHVVFETTVWSPWAHGGHLGVTRGGNRGPDHPPRHVFP